MNQAPTPSVFSRIELLLQGKSILFSVAHHEPVYTSEQAAAVRGVPLASGAKALVVKIDDRFVLFVVPADRKLDSKKVRASLKVKAIRFASKEEVLQITGLEPGSIPPFGSLFNLSTYVDPALGQNETINFNAGDHSISVQMTYRDYLSAESPTPAEVT
jgi:Ala-tRNA(Pro) deacylase